MKDGEADFSNYTHEQIARSLDRIDQKEYPLNYARLLAAQRSLPPLPMDRASVDARENARLLQEVASGKTWLSAPGPFTFWLPCLSRVVVRGDSLEVRTLFGREKLPLTEITHVRWDDERPLDGWHLGVIELHGGRRVRMLPRSSAVMRAFAAHVGGLKGGVDVADPNYKSAFWIGGQY